jgi:sortase (surface protein transpeptidase)
VLDCTGGKMGAIRPYPLSTGDSLEIPVGAGESIDCYWYNVPGYDDGRLTVIKYQCATMTYTSDIDCEIYEGGQAFDLLAWNGSGWDDRATLATDGVGQATFTGLAPGDYWLEEHDGEWCHIASERLSGDGDSIAVAQGEETVVRVYNCSGDPGDAGKPGKIPTKYPNTGVSPAGSDFGSPAELSAPGAIGGLLSLLAPFRRNVMPRSYTRRQALTGIGLPLAGSLMFGRPVLAQGEGPDATPSSAIPDRLCLPATPTAGGEAACERGPVPATLRIDAIGVDAPVEVLEVVGGVMQQPTDEVHVAWYKESARLGEIGNIWLAGHLNWWTTPVAVFSNLGLLREGDEVVLLDAEGAVRTYAVEWVRQESNLEPPREEALGMTDHEAVTLITCSGEWNNDISEYDARTVVRASQLG